MILLKELRKEKNLTQSEIAKALNISRQVYANYENEINQPDCKMLIQLANFFEVSVDELLGREDFTPEEKAAGISATRKISITPLEDDLLYTFRQIGKRFGEQAQRDYITVGENMLKLK